MLRNSGDIGLQPDMPVISPAYAPGCGVLNPPNASTGTEWVTGASDGTLALWSQTKKRPTSILRKAHGYPKAGFVPQQTLTAPGLDAATGRNADAATNSGAAVSGPGEEEGPRGPGSVGGDAASWIGAVGVCRGTDLVVRLFFADQMHEMLFLVVLIDWRSPNITCEHCCW